MINKKYKDDNIEEFAKRTWLEISCGEAPYIVTRYEPTSGEMIPIYSRVGFLDRKLLRINQEIESFNSWLNLVILSYQSCYGFELNGDSLFIARENLVYSFIEYYVMKWKKIPEDKLIKKIADIISYNIFQMDGITKSIPYTEKIIYKDSEQLKLFETNGEDFDLFGETESQLELFDGNEYDTKIIMRKPVKAKIMNWLTGNMEDI